MRILYLSIGDSLSPGTRYRVLSYRQSLSARGHQVRVLFPLLQGRHSRTVRRLCRPFEILRDLIAARSYDLVVSYRKTFPLGTAAILRRFSRKILFEFDDAIWLPSPSEPTTPSVVTRYRQNFMATINVADLVIAGNRTIGAVAAAAGVPVEVVPTPVDLDIFQLSLRTPHRERFVIGWIGTAENLPQWTRLVPAFRRLIERHPFVQFKVISDRQPPACGLPVIFERFTLEREASCLGDVNVAIMPLDDTPWNRGKCSIKALQGMALGLPVVVSPVGMNCEVVEHSVNGFFATTEQEWVTAFDQLAADPNLAARMGRAARRTVETRYSLEVLAPRMTAILETVA